MIVTSEGIVLNSRKFGDSSKIINLFSMDYGKISLIAKGARVPKSKFGSSLEPLSCTNATFYIKPNTELYLLSKSELSKKWLRIYNSAEHLSAGFSVLETISITQLQKHPNPELYGVLSDTLDYLNELHDNPQSLVIWFFCKFAEIMGFELNFEDIDKCNDHIYAIIIENGSISLSSTNIPHRTFKFNLALLQKFARINYSDISLISKFDLTKIEISTLYNFFGTYFSYHFNYNFVLKSGNIL